MSLVPLMMWLVAYVSFALRSWRVRSSLRDAVIDVLQDLNGNIFAADQLSVKKLNIAHLQMKSRVLKG